jgi:5-hydroxyisourate hydrolase
VTGISTHVLDTGVGRPASGVAIRLEHWGDGAWRRVGDGVTDGHGRVPDLLGGATLVSGRYRVIFDTGGYGHRFYPEVVVCVEVEDPGEHLHIPLLLSPFGYTTYRGS